MFRPDLLAVSQLGLSAEVLVEVVDLLGLRDHHLYFDCHLLLCAPLVEVDVPRPVAVRHAQAWLGAEEGQGSVGHSQQRLDYLRDMFEVVLELIDDQDPKPESIPRE